jgi:AAA domain
LKRLRVVKSGLPLYDQEFHLGVNIIRGENGSGKSTIADFIFYSLGGEFENWKAAAAKCDEVQAEVVTQGGTLTLRRAISKAQTPIDVFFGSMSDAEKHGLDGWNRYPIRRTEGHESFSQAMFRACGIPEAQSQGASNITMHQILRLLYSDQRTPAAFLFRYESFDTKEIREAVGDLICGLSVYELYEVELRLRDLAKQFDEKDRHLSALLSAMPSSETLTSVRAVDDRLMRLVSEYDRVSQEIINADQHVNERQVQSFLSERTKAVQALRKVRQEISSLEDQRQVNELEKADLNKFIEYLTELSGRLAKTQASLDIVGNIEFSRCPACLAELASDTASGHCVVCGAETDPEKERSRYLQIKMDIDIQIRESRQLLDDKCRASSHLDRENRELRRVYQEGLSEFSVKYDMSISPRDSFLAERHQRLGQIDRERTELGRLRERALQIQVAIEEKAELQAEISRLRDRQKAIEASSGLRRGTALTLVSNTARKILRDDLERQQEFRAAQTVSVNFADNSVLVDKELNFAESSNVIVKNAAILSLLLGATTDELFYHPRFAIFDNIEDKGMEQDRSHNFQQLIVRLSAEARLKHQIIFTTSMPNPQLETTSLVVGPHYTHENRTLAFVQSTQGT